MQVLPKRKRIFFGRGTMYGLRRGKVSEFNGQQSVRQLQDLLYWGAVSVKRRTMW
jgi:hypothetical protein